MARKDLATILAEEKILVARDLERLQRERVASGRPLWTLLLEAELSTDEELFFLLAQRWQVATEAALEKVDVPEAARRVWSREEASAKGILPVEIEGNRATVIMVDPSDEQSLGELVGRLKLNEARVLLGRRSRIERAIARIFGDTPQSGSTAPQETTAQVKLPITGKLRPIAKTTETKIVSPQRPRGKTEPKVQIDPQLAEEMQRLPPRALEAEALTPMPRVRRRRTGPISTVPAGTPAADAKPFTIEDALRAEERLSRALLQAVEALSHLLEQQLDEKSAAKTAGDDSGRVSRIGYEMARLSRRVARKLGLDRRSADEVGAAAYLFAVDRKLKQVPESSARAADWFGDIGWSGANEDGLLTILRALTAITAGFARTGNAPGSTPLGARIITVVDDYLQLGVASAEIDDLGTVSQLLRASPAGAQVVDALLRVLESERISDPTPATTVTAQSVLHPPAPDETDANTPSPIPDPIVAPIEEEKTQRKMAPTAPPPPARVRHEKEK
jgi:Type II secretion system (T2SS), protein E, N-terminal domain